MTSLVNLSRKELLAACESLIREVGSDKAQCLLSGIVKAKSVQTIAAQTAPITPTVNAGEERPGKKARKEFDFSRYPQKHVALWVGYFGERYNGLATASVQGPNDQTVEWKLLEALRKVKLIDPDGNFETWSYSRCGRTDKGVSGLGQVISMKVRGAPGDKDMDYASMLNGNLPDDIMVLAWAPVDGVTTENAEGVKLPFDARFSCRSRTYRYFFRTQKLDIAKMHDACKRLEGTHDFRNFCKIDLDNAKTFERTIDVCKIVQNECMSSDMNYIEIRGTAFLWHQIRLIMAVLFHVGAGLESPMVIDYLLDIKACPSRPSFPMASELPLVLYSCAYDPNLLQWRYSEKNVARLVSRLNVRLGEDKIRCELTKSFLDVLTTAPFPSVADSVDLDHDEIADEAKRKRHKAFSERIKCKSVEEHERDRQEEAGSKKISG